MVCYEVNVCSIAWIKRTQMNDNGRRRMSKNAQYHFQYEHLHKVSTSSSYFAISVRTTFIVWCTATFRTTLPMNKKTIELIKTPKKFESNYIPGCPLH